MLPVLKEKKRYVLYHIDSVATVAHMEKFLVEKLRQFIGDLGLAKAGLRFITYKNNQGVLQVNHISVNDIRAGLALIDMLGQHVVRIRTLKVSGILHKLQI